MVDRPGVNSIFGDADDDDFEITGGSDGGSTAPKNQPSKPAVTPPTPVKKPGVPSAVPSPTTGVPNPLAAIRRPSSGAALPPSPRSNPLPAPKTPTPTPHGLPTKPTLPTSGQAPATAQPSLPKAPLPTSTQPALPTQPVQPALPAVAQPEPVSQPVPETTPTFQTPVVPEPLPAPVQQPEPVPVTQWEQPPVQVQQPRPQPMVEEHSPKQKSKKNSSSGKKNTSKKRNQKNGEKPPSQFSGGRKGVIAFRVGLFSLMLLLAFAGAKSVISPPAFPGPDQVVSRVKEGLGITEFPISSGEGFVLGFTRAYLEFDAESRSARDATLQNYAPEGVLANIRMTMVGNDPPAQTITAGPYITGARSVDDENAVYTVAAEINGGNWVYLDIPLIYDAESNAFAISGSPSFIGPPIQAEVPGQPLDGTPDTELSQEVRERLERFFMHWGNSELVDLKSYITQEADPSARYGLGGTVTFDKINVITILEPKPDANPNIREGRVQVSWGSPSSPETTYTQTYDIVLKKLDSGLWNVQEIRGGIPSEQAGGSSDNTGKPVTGSSDDQGS